MVPMQVSPVLKTIMDMAGEKFVLIRDGVELEIIDGLRNKDQYSQRLYIAVYPGTDVRAGDWLRAVASGDELVVVENDIEVCDGNSFQGRAFYTTRSEWEQNPGIFPGSTGPDEDGPAPKPALQNPAWLDDHINYLQALVKVKAPGHTEEFQPLLDELHSILAENTISKGVFSKYAPLLNSYPWFNEALADSFMQWLCK